MSYYLGPITKSDIAVIYACFDYKDGNRHKEVLRRATLYCKNGVLFENAVTSLVGQFGENSRAGLRNADIKSMVNSCYNKARGEFGIDRATFLKKKNADR